MEQAWKRKEISGALSMGVAAAFPSVDKRCLLRKMRNMRIGEDLVGWTSSFMQERRVQMVIDRHHGGDH